MGLGFSSVAGECLLTPRFLQLINVSPVYPSERVVFPSLQLNCDDSAKKASFQRLNRNFA